MLSAEYECVILLKSNSTSDCQVFWGKNEDRFSEEYSKRFQLKPGYNSFKIELGPELQAVDRIRVDLGDQRNKTFEILYCIVRRKGFIPHNFFLREIRPYRDVILNFNLNSLEVLTTSNDPSFFISLNIIDLDYDLFGFLKFICIHLVIVSILVLIWNPIKHQGKNLFETITTLGIAIVFAFVISLSISARFGEAPDERDHFLASEYFRSYNIVPSMNDADALYTYNLQWAYSRVYQLGIHYYFAGKLSNLFDGILPSHISVRMLGPILLLILLLINLYIPEFSATYLVALLISPQIWYVFSYVNDDYFPLFMSVIIMILTEMYYDRIYEYRLIGDVLVLVLILGILLGEVMISKSNYLIFFILYSLYLLMPAVQSFFQRDIEKFRRLIKIPSLIIVISLIFSGLNHGLAYGKSKIVSYGIEDRVLMQMQSNKSDLLSKGRSGQEIYGSYQVMFRDWMVSSYKSFNGVYGAMKHYGDDFIYMLFFIVHLLLFIIFIKYVFNWFNWEVCYIAVITISCFIALLFASSYWISYSYDYQPQGRYLFPILPFIGMILNRLQKTYNVVIKLVIFLIGLSIISFLFYGVYNL